MAKHTDSLPVQSRRTKDHTAQHKLVNVIPFFSTPIVHSLKGWYVDCDFRLRISWLFGFVICRKDALMKVVYVAMSVIQRPLVVLMNLSNR